MTLHNFDLKDDVIASLLNEDDDQKLQIISVSDVIRRHFGRYKVKGIIIGISKLFKMISKVGFYCDYCKKYVEIDFPLPVFTIKDIEKKCNQCQKFSKNSFNLEYKNAVAVELQDTETFNDMDRLPVYLFDNDTEGIRVGETVTIIGDIQIVNNRKLFTCLYAESIQYLNREDVILTELDRQAIKRFVQIKQKNGINIMDALVELFDPSIVGYEHVKKGLLMSTVNTSEIASIKEKINELLIGDPGNAKSALVKRITQLVTGSNYISAQNSSGKSLTAIIDKAEDNLFLRVGPVPQARSAISGLNELGRTSMEDQSHLLDVMQEEEFTKTAYGFHVKIKSPVTVIASANPVNNSKWKDDDKIDLNEFPIYRPLLDRFDLKFAFRTRKDPNEIKEFGKKYSEMLAKKEKGQLPDYTPFLVKYIEYARQLKPEISEEARIMLYQFYIEVKIKQFGSDRVLPTLHKLVKAVARLKLKQIADKEDATEAMKFYNVMLSDFQKSVVISQPPKDIAYNECTKLLEEIKKIGGITVEELIKQICEHNEQLAYYFGYNSNREQSLKMRDNIKIRDLVDRLLNHSKIKRIKEKPIVLQWLCDPCDPCDGNSKHKTEKNENENNNLQSKSGSHTSHGSHTTTEETLKGIQLNKDGPIHLEEK